MKKFILILIVAPLMLMTLTGGVMAASEHQHPAYAAAAIATNASHMPSDVGLAFDTLKLAGKHWVRDMTQLWNDPAKNLVEKAGYGVAASAWRVTEVGFTFTGYALQTIGVL